MSAVETVNAVPVFDHPSAAGRALNERVSALVAKAKILHARAAAAVLVALARYADARGRCFCAQETLARQTHYSVRHVQRVLDQAEAKGLVLRAVPRYAARLLGTATEYTLPWWALTAAKAMEGAREVLGLRRKGPAVAITRDTAAKLIELVEDLHPVELARRVAGRIPGFLAGEVVRAYAGALIPREGRARGAAPLASLLPQTTPGLDKTSPKRTLGSDSPSGSREEGSDQGAKRPALGEATFAERLAAASRAALAAAKARDARVPKPPLSESS